MHVDQDPASRMKVLYKVVPRPIADDIVQTGKRFQIMNVWYRNLASPITHPPPPPPAAKPQVPVFRAWPREKKRLSWRRPIVPRIGLTRRPRQIWRPLSTVHKDPFAVCDLQTVSPEDLRTMRFRLPNGTPLSNTAVLPSPRHRLYYKYRQRADEPLVFLQFDSGLPGGPARAHGQTPHTAIVDDEREERERARPAGAPPSPERWSIEIRALVVYGEGGCTLPPDHLALGEAASRERAAAEAESPGEERISCPYTAFIKHGRS